MGMGRTTLVRAVSKSACFSKNKKSRAVGYGRDVIDTHVVIEIALEQGTLPNKIGG